MDYKIRTYYNTFSFVKSCEMLKNGLNCTNMERNINQCENFSKKYQVQKYGNYVKSESVKKFREMFRKNVLALRILIFQCTLI